MLLSNAPLTLAQYYLQANEPIVQAIAYALIDNGSVLTDIPIVNNQSIYVNGVRFPGGSLPNVLWVPLNQDPQNVAGTPQGYQEQIYILRETIDVDKYLVMDRNAIRNPRAVQVDAALKAITYDVNYKFINNDHVTGDVNSFVGLRYRINNGSTYGVRPENIIDAGGVDLSTAGLTVATANSFVEFLDNLLWAVDAPQGSTNVVLYMNDVMWRRMHRAMRIMGTSGGFDITRDQFNRVLITYKGCPVRDIGYKADLTTRIIPSIESNTGNPSGGTFTSIYAVNYGDNHFMGWQFEPLAARDLGLLNNGVTYRTLIDWSIGFINQSTRSIARLFDIKLA